MQLNRTKTMQLPIEIVRDILSLFLIQTELDFRSKESNHSSLIKDINSLGSVSRFFRAMIFEVKYKSVALDREIKFCIGYQTHIKVSFEKFSEYFEFISSNGLSFNLSKSLKYIYMSLENDSYYAFIQLSHKSQYDLQSLNFCQLNFDDLLVDERTKEIISRIGSLQRVDLDNDDDVVDVMNFYPTSINIIEVFISPYNIERYGIQRLNAHKSIKTIYFQGFWGDDALENSHLLGFDLELQELKLTICESFNPSSFDCCINSLTHLVIHVFEAYDISLLFISKFLNLQLLDLKLCEEVSAEFFPALLRLVSPKRLNIQSLEVNFSNSTCIFLNICINVRPFDVETQRSSIVIV